MLNTLGPRSIGARFLWTAAASREIGQVPLAVIDPGIPIISAPDPVPGDFSTDREADRRTIVSFTYQRRNPLAQPFIWCQIGFEVFVIYDGHGFVGIFDGFCTITQVGEQLFELDVIPAGGWWGQVAVHGGDVVEGGVVE